VERQIDRGWRVLSSGKIDEQKVDGDRQIARDYRHILQTGIKRVIWKDRWINRQQVDK
jgi:hypothetical protein